MYMYHDEYLKKRFGITLGAYSDIPNQEKSLEVFEGCIESILSKIGIEIDESQIKSTSTKDGEYLEANVTAEQTGIIRIMDIIGEPVQKAVIIPYNRDDIKRYFNDFDKNFEVVDIYIDEEVA